MKDRDTLVSTHDRAFVVAWSIVAGAIAAFFVFLIVFAAATADGSPAAGFVIGLLLGLIVLALIPFAYQTIGRICAIQEDQTREETYKRSIEPWTKSQVVRRSTYSPFTIGPTHLWYFGIQYFDEQWSEKNLQESPSSSKNPAETRST